MDSSISTAFETGGIYSTLSDQAKRTQFFRMGKYVQAPMRCRIGTPNLFDGAPYCVCATDALGLVSKT